MSDHKTLERDLAHALNCNSAENASNTPDYILAQFLGGCLAAWNTAAQQRETWHGRDARPSEAAATVQQHPYGACPQCFASGVMRERRPDGNDRCASGHTYPSRTAVPVGTLAPPKPAALVSLLDGLLASMGREPTEAELRAAAHMLTVRADKLAAGRERRNLAPFDPWACM